MGARVKICGLNTPETVDAALAARADYLGFNFYQPSPRFVSLAQVQTLSARAAGKATCIGVFVDPDDRLLADAIAAGGLSVVQLHRVTADRRAAVAAQFGVQVWAVVEVSKPGDLAARGHLEAANRVLYDAKTPKDALPGGMGLRFDWSMLSGLSHPWPWGLAGGLTPTNVGEAIRLTGAPLVDCSSGVETSPGVKDPALIADFCKAARLG